MPHLVYLLTDSKACGFLRGQAGFMRNHGFDVTLISSPGERLEKTAREEQVRAEPVPMQREISPWHDVVSLVRLVRVLRRLRPDIVNAGTPKAALLGMIAAWITRVPVRIYTLYGLRLETTRGPKRLALFAAEKLTTRLAQRVICVSESLRQRYIGLVPGAAHKAVVLGAGSHNGVDASQFSPCDDLRQQADALRQHFDITPETPVIGFVGRFVRDKGIEELTEAFVQIRMQHPDARLLLLGDFETGDPVSPQCKARLREDPQVILPGFIKDTAAYYFLMDVLALPSYREGLPSVPLEASLAEVPVVGFRSTGMVDAVRDGQTGLLVDVGDADALASAILRYLDDPNLRQQHGRAGRRWVLEAFRPQRIWEALRGEYNTRLKGQATCDSVPDGRG